MKRADGAYIAPATLDGGKSRFVDGSDGGHDGKKDHTVQFGGWWGLALGSAAALTAMQGVLSGPQQQPQIRRSLND